MTDGPGVLLYCDEGPGVGLGHRARCEAIARSLRARGHAANVLPISSGIVAAPVIVVDSYLVRADDRRHFVPDVVVAIDDLERDLAVDCVVAPSPGARSEMYHRGGCVLAGVRYALLGPAAEPAAADGSATRVLVSTGAADRDGIGARIAALLRATRPDITIELVVGPWGCASVPDGVEAVVGATSLGALLARADVVVTAGGVTLLEALHLGRPCVAFAVADNQTPNVDAVGRAGAAVVTDVAGAAQAASRLLDDTVRRVELSARGAQLVDGRGAARVAEVITSFARPPRFPGCATAVQAGAS